MKKVFTLALVLASITVFSQDYFWVGGSGSWSDLSHWATSSGGSTFHATLPGADNDVYLDENSFPEPNGVLLLDLEEAYCRNFDASAATNNPSVNGDYYLDDLIVNGDIIVPASVGRDFKTLVLTGSGNHIAELGGVNCGGLSFIRHQGTGSYTQQDSLSCANLYIQSDGGTWITNGQPLNASVRLRTYSGYSSIFDAQGSNIYTNEFTMAASNTLNFTNTQIFISGASGWDITGGGETLPYVEVTGEHVMPEDISIGELVLNPGASLHMEPGVTVTAEQFTLAGESDDPIYINSIVAGEEAYFSQASGSVDATWLVLQDNHAIGGASFNAEFSVDNGNTDGWNIVENIPQTYYWVGGTGDWTDVTHWAATSGGSDYFDYPPTLQDDVIFDENSFASATDVVTIEGDAYVDDLDASAAMAGPLVDSYGLSSLIVHGNFHGGSLSWDLSDLIMNNGADVDFETTSSDLVETVLRLEGTGTVWLQDSLSLVQFHIANGDFVSGGNPIHTTNNFTVPNPDVSTIDLSDSHIYVYSWSAISPNSNYYMDNSTFHVTNGFSMGNGVEYNDVIFTGDAHTYGVGSIQTLTIEPQASLEIYDGTTVVLDDLVAVGTADDLIEIRCVDDGGTGYFSKESGEINVYFVDLKDNHAIGGATFNAWSSVDNGNVEGWNIDELEGAAYYWVGGNGDWSDVSHWATTSGGAEFHLTPPDFEDDVFMDANSFTAAGEAVTITDPAYLKSFNADGAIAETVLDGSSSMTIKGAFNGGDMSVAVGAIFMDNPGDIAFSSATGAFDNTIIRFGGVGAVSVTDSLSASEIYCDYGDVDFMENAVNTSSLFQVLTPQESTIDLSNCEIYASTWEGGSTTAIFDFSGSHFRVSEYFYGGNDHQYHDLTFIADAFMNGSSSFNVITIEPDASLQLEIGITVTIEDLIAVGTEDNHIEISCATDGGTAFFSKPSGEVNCYYLDLKDNHAVGGATFNAWQSQDLGNVEGWEFIIVDNVDEASAEVNIWPNPTNGSIQIASDTQLNYILIYDNSGRLVQTEPINALKAQLNLSTLPSGIYYLMSPAIPAWRQRVVVVE